MAPASRGKRRSRGVYVHSSPSDSGEFSRPFEACQAGAAVTLRSSAVLAHIVTAWVTNPAAPDAETHRSRPGWRASTTTEAEKLRSTFFAFQLPDDDAK
jgi:hypothetical protein